MFHLPYSKRHYASPIPGAPALEVRQLAVMHADSDSLALKDVSLTVQPGERAALIGANGAGKTTLLKAIAGLLPIVSGEILIYGLPIGACHHRVAYLPQRGEIDWRFPITLRHLVMTGRYVHLGWLRRPGREDSVAVERALQIMGLTELANRQIGQLSGGQQQRTLLARALAQDADLLLLDEPLNAIDKDTRAMLVHIMDDLRRQGKTVVMATHDLSRLEHDFERILTLVDGRETLIIEGEITSEVSPATV